MPSENTSWSKKTEGLLNVTGAYFTMEELGFESMNVAALCFAEVETNRFDSMMDEVHDLLDESDQDGTEARINIDSHGYQWIIFSDEEIEDLVSSINFVVDTFGEEGYETRLLAALYGFERDEDEDTYLVYSFRQHTFYPFVPVDTDRRNSSLEFKLESMLDNSIPIEKNKENWHPLWPDSKGEKPWGSVKSRSQTSFSF